MSPRRRSHQLSGTRIPQPRSAYLARRPSNSESIPLTHTSLCVYTGRSVAHLRSRSLRAKGDTDDLFLQVTYPLVNLSTRSQVEAKTKKEVRSTIPIGNEISCSPR